MSHSGSGSALQNRIRIRMRTFDHNLGPGPGSGSWSGCWIRIRAWIRLRVRIRIMMRIRISITIRVRLRTSDEDHDQGHGQDQDITSGLLPGLPVPALNWHRLARSSSNKVTWTWDHTWQIPPSYCGYPQTDRLTGKTVPYPRLDKAMRRPKFISGTLIQGLALNIARFLIDMVTKIYTTKYT